MSDSVDLRLRGLLARELCALFEGWKSAEIVARTGMYPSRVSELCNGKLARFPVARLVQLINDRGYDIEIALRPTRKPPRAAIKPALTLVRYG